MAKPKQPERDAEIVRLFCLGRHTVELGALFGLSGSRVAQVIKDAGVSKWDGGRHVAATLRAPLLRAREDARRAASRRATRERECQRLLGCDYETALRLNRGKSLYRLDYELAGQFRAQRDRARQRGIGWELTFPEWIGVWEASGKIEQRGRSHKDSYVMARKGDVGPYSIANVYITTLSQNFLDFHVKARAEGYLHFKKNDQV